MRKDHGGEGGEDEKCALFLWSTFVSEHSTCTSSVLVYEFYRHSDKHIIFRHGFNFKIIHLHKIHISTAMISMNKHSTMTHASSLARTNTHIYIHREKQSGTQIPRENVVRSIPERMK